MKKFYEFQGFMAFALLALSHSAEARSNFGISLGLHYGKNTGMHAGGHLYAGSPAFNWGGHGQFLACMQSGHWNQYMNPWQGGWHANPGFAPMPAPVATLPAVPPPQFIVPPHLTQPPIQRAPAWAYPNPCAVYCVPATHGHAQMSTGYHSGHGIHAGVHTGGHSGIAVGANGSVMIGADAFRERNEWEKNDTAEIIGNVAWGLQGMTTNVFPMVGPRGSQSSVFFEPQNSNWGLHTRPAQHWED